MGRRTSVPTVLALLVSGVVVAAGLLSAPAPDVSAAPAAVVERAAGTLAPVATTPTPVSGAPGSPAREPRLVVPPARSDRVP
jgi:hypothetical protein